MTVGKENEGWGDGRARVRGGELVGVIKERGGRAEDVGGVCKKREGRAREVIT